MVTASLARRGMGRGRIGSRRLAGGAVGPVTPASRGNRAPIRPSRITAGEFLMDGIGRALGLGTSGRRLPAAQVLAYLQDRRLLLVLDGLEPLLNELGVLTDLLAGAKQMRLLVTCRRRLDLRGEQAVRIGRLDVPDPGADDLATLTGLASVQVFGEWARRVWPEFALDSGNARDVAEICRTMAGVPLGIALAASMADHLTAGQIVEAIRGDPGQVTARWPDAPARHRGLRAFCQYAHLLLSTEERAALRSLARLDALFNLAEAQQVAGVQLAQLRALVEWGLVERADPGQFFMAPMDRYFASARGD